MADRSPSINPVRKVFRSGGSVVLPLPLDVRREVGIGVGDRVMVTAVDGEYVKIVKMGDKNLEGKTRLYNYSTNYDEAHAQREGFGEPGGEYPANKTGDKSDHGEADQEG